MANVITRQRRPLEELTSVKVGGKRRYFLDGEEIFLGGVSEGIGTCSDVHGMNIAVFFENSVNRDVPETWCASAALERPPMGEEGGECPKDGRAWRVVELLFPVKQSPDRIEFARSGRKQVYVNTIC